VVAEGVAVQTAQKNASFEPKSDSIKLTQESPVAVDVALVEVVETTVVKKVKETLFVIEVDETLVKEVLAEPSVAGVVCGAADVVGLTGVVEPDELGVADPAELDDAVVVTELEDLLAAAATAA